MVRTRSPPSLSGPGRPTSSPTSRTSTAAAAVDFDAIYSGGLNIRGGGWGRENDTIGIGYGYLNGGNLELSETHVAEVYYKLGLGERVSLTADAQYMKDNKRNEDSPEGWIFSMRGTVAY